MLNGAAGFCDHYAGPSCSITEGNFIMSSKILNFLGTLYTMQLVNERVLMFYVLEILERPKHVKPQSV